jgi:hypothetical protein
MKKWGYVVSWLPMGVVVTLMSLMVYGAVQQSIRLGANIPQIQMAEDAALDIVRGIAPQAVLPKQNVDIAASLAPFMIIYDDSGQILASTAVLDAGVPELPAGVLDLAREKKEDRVTWEPKKGVRSAAVVVRYVGDKPGFVLAGRSLREVEKLEEQIFLKVIIAWAVTMVGTLGAYYFTRR